jgi:hypothetical protein
MRSPGPHSELNFAKYANVNIRSRFDRTGIEVFDAAPPQ